MKKIISLFVILVMLFGITACGSKKEKSKNSKDAIKFKEEYESYNELVNEYFDYRDISIDKENPIIYSTAEEIVKKIENKDTFIVYFGDPECPWCRSVIEQAIKSAKVNKINKIYYVRFWNGFHIETIRDVYELDNNNKPVLKQEGTEAYQKLLTYLGNVLSDYTLKDSDGNIVNVNEKRIFLPNFVIIKKGEPIELIQGISDKQESYNVDLTDEVIKDEQKMFNDFFSKYSK